MMVNDLKAIQKNAPNVLLGEVVAALHNIGKCSEEFIAKLSSESELKEKEIPLFVKKAKLFDYQYLSGALLLEGFRKRRTLKDFCSGEELKGLKKQINRSRRRISVRFLHRKFCLKFLLQQKLYIPEFSRSDFYLGCFLDFQDFHWYRQRETSPPWIELFAGKNYQLLRLAQICHALSSASEKTTEKNLLAKQPYNRTFIANAFGYETKRIEVETALLKRNRSNLLKILNKEKDVKNVLKLTGENNEILKKFEKAFLHALGDTQRPINDVTLWDLSYSTASFFKAALALVCLEPNSPAWKRLVSAPKHQVFLPWQFLIISWNYDRFVQSSARIVDLLSRKRYLDNALSRVKNLLENEYPMANEIFRDENCIIFLAPGEDASLLALKEDATMDDSRSLGRLIESKFLRSESERNKRKQRSVEKYAEIVPHMECLKLDFELTSLGFGAAMGEHRACDHTSDGCGFSDLWAKVGGFEVCSVCGLRPVACDDEGNKAPHDFNDGKSKAEKRGVCWICEERREDRAHEWVMNQMEYKRTIWINEVSDSNNRAAMLVGRFGLDEWFDEDKNLCAAMRKSPSFARLRRIWETTKAFWHEVNEKLLPTVLCYKSPVSPKRQLRLHLFAKEAIDLGKFHAYEMEFDRVRFGVLWDGERFHTTENLEVLSKRLAPSNNENGLKRLKKGVRIKIFEPTGYGKSRANVEFTTITLVDDPKWMQNAYLPLISLLDYPTAYMAIVPAKEAFNLSLEIKIKYDLEMGKVKDRLPLNLGIIYFPRQMPVAAVLDAGRRMMRHPNTSEHWELLSKSSFDARHMPSICNPGIYELTFDAKKRERQVTSVYNILRGDGKPDKFHPHLLVQKPVTERNNPNSAVLEEVSSLAEDYEALHIGDLLPGDRVRIAVSHFDFVFLDLAGKRFELTVPEGALCRPNETLDTRRGTRPYLLEDMHRLKNLWEIIQSSMVGKSESAIYGIRDLLLQKYRTWRPGECDVGCCAFESLVNPLISKEFGLDKNKDDGKRRLLHQAIMDGSFFDCLEIYLHIMKEKLGKGKSDRK